MIVLDTNVVSEPLRPTADSTVLAWLDEQEISTLYLTAITVAELRYGIAVLPLGRRKRQLQEDFDRRILSLFAGRILPFDEAATRACADLRAKAKAEGRAIGLADSLIAAIASHHRFQVATRDTAPFRAAGVAVIDPWTASSR